MTRGRQYVVQVRTQAGWATLSQPAHRKDAFNLAALVGGRVYNMYMRRVSTND